MPARIGRRRPPTTLARLAGLAGIGALLIQLAPFTAEGGLARADVEVEAEPPPIPEHNNPRLRRAPPLPPIGEADVARARVLLAGILADDPRMASAAFLPEAAFALIKGVADPGRIYRRLMRAFEADVHALHEQVPSGAVVDGLDLSRRRSWVERGQEANRLPYWSARHNTLRWRVPAQTGAEAGEDGAAVSGEFEVRTLITWDDQWYITHLREFRH